MSGHSKWANIKHKKGKADALRGKITTKISREITIAVRPGLTIVMLCVLPFVWALQILPVT